MLCVVISFSFHELQRTLCGVYFGLGRHCGLIHFLACAHGGAELAFIIRIGIGCINTSDVMLVVLDRVG